jgi:hypothetical protein
MVGPGVPPTWRAVKELGCPTGSNVGLDDKRQSARLSNRFRPRADAAEPASALTREVSFGPRSLKIAWLESEVSAWLGSRPQRKIKPLPGQTAQRPAGILTAKNHRDKAHKTTTETNANI